MKRRALLLTIALLTTACSSGNNPPNSSAAATTSTNPTNTTAPVTTTTPPTSTTSPTTTTTTAAPATTTTTAAPATTTPATTTPATTASTCQPRGNTLAAKKNFPEQLSALIGKDIRVGTHDCFERVVIELQPGVAPIPSPFPGYWVRYATGPITLSPSDLPVTITGNAVLLISMGSWMQTMEGAGYQGPQQIFPTNVSHIRELRMIENYEGMMQWAVGLDAPRNFVVATLSNPPRLVIDIQTSP
ncbi:unannotated protein [freshwater metagenome]|uniref:Unannotated protein n=1 Tax=freshwater metagenome TaxID=449393 RepID=A0A6J7EPZ2_9ZZZZ|nr:hypothetical protein [Actinomycetota bacterium]